MKKFLYRLLKIIDWLLFIFPFLCIHCLIFFVFDFENMNFLFSCIWGPANWKMRMIAISLISVLLVHWNIFFINKRKDREYLNE